MKKFSDIYTKHTHTEIENLVNESYDHLYNDTLYQNAMYYTIDVYDYMIKHNDAFKLFINLFTTLRGDCLTSDREVIALMDVLIKNFNMAPINQAIKKIYKEN